MSTDLDLDAQRQALLAKREALQALEAVGLEAEETVELDQGRVGRLSRMDALQGQAMSKEAHRRRDIELKMITAALERLDEGEYGECQACGEMIAAARLKVDPAVDLCIACAERRESDSEE